MVTGYSESPNPQTDSARPWVDRSLRWLLALIVILIPFDQQLTILLDLRGPTGIEPLISAVRVSALDPLLLGLVVVVGSALALMSPRIHVFLWPCIGLVGWSALLVLIRPDWLTTGAAARIAGFCAVILAASFLATSERRTWLVTPLVAGAVLQAAIALVQVATNSGRVVDASLSPFGASWTAGYGTFQGPYTLAAFLTLAAFAAIAYPFKKRWVVYASVAACSAGIATTFGRTAAVSLAVGSVSLVVASLVYGDRSWIRSLASLTVPFMGIVAALNSGWRVRFEDVRQGNTNNRGDLLSQAVDLVSENLAFGVGPGRYSQVVPPDQLFVVHNVPLATAVEMGLVGATLMIAILTIAAMRSMRRPATVALFASLLPWMVFDNLHIVFTTGVAMFAVWLALSMGDLESDVPDDKPTREGLRRDPY